MVHLAAVLGVGIGARYARAVSGWSSGGWRIAVGDSPPSRAHASARARYSSIASRSPACVVGQCPVEVIGQSSDGGVDVIADIQLGVTSVREVVQAKRHKRTIQRKDLDALRGSLYRFNAVRGTIVATSRRDGVEDPDRERGHPRPEIRRTVLGSGLLRATAL